LISARELSGPLGFSIFLLYTMRMRLAVGWFVICSVLVACQKSHPKDGVVRLAVMTQLAGNLTPCGCTSKPLGGLDRVVQFIGDKPLLVVGDTFYGDEPLDAQIHLKAEAISKILHRLSVVSMALGQHDAVSRVAEFKLPMFKVGSTHDNFRRVDSTLRTLNGLKVAIIGTSYEPRVTPQDHTFAAKAMRAQGAEFVISLLPMNVREAQKFVAQMDRVDVAIAEGEADPLVISETLLLAGGEKGETIGTLSLHPKKDRTWVFYDAGQSARKAVQERINRLQQEIETLGQGEARKVREQQLQGLHTQLAQITVQEPLSSYVSWDLQTMDISQPKASWATDILKDLNQALCTEADKARPCPPDKPGTEHFVGTQACMACHPAAYSVYSKTQHAHAWATLERDGKQCDTSCIGCHSVGFNQPGGYCRVKDVESYRNVGCENCHGPGQTHVQNLKDRSKWSMQFVVKPTVEKCLTCHTPDHSDKFKFEVYLPKILGEGHRLK